jgi:hypothetical protein
MIHQQREGQIAEKLPTAVSYIAKLGQTKEINKVLAYGGAHKLRVQL